MYGEDVLMEHHCQSGFQDLDDAPHSGRLMEVDEEDVNRYKPVNNNSRYRREVKVIKFTCY